MNNDAAKPKLKLLVVANKVSWLSLNEQLQHVIDFYEPVVVLEVTVVKTSYTPIYRALPDGISVIDPAWYETNITIPNALTYDLNLFITPLPGTPATYRGYMNPVNIGPWETTVFVAGEKDHTYANGHDFGPTLSLYACHELSHAFYYMLGKKDDTHMYFPVGQDGHQFPEDVLSDFDFSSRGGILAWLRERLLSAMLYLRFIRKQRVLALTADSVQQIP